MVIRVKVIRMTIRVRVLVNIIREWVNIIRVLVKIKRVWIKRGKG